MARRRAAWESEAGLAVDGERAVTGGTFRPFMQGAGLFHTVD